MRLLPLSRSLLVLALVACRREEHAVAGLHAPASAHAIAEPAARTTATSTAASAEAPPPSVNAEEAAAGDTVRAWSTALDQHETTKLGELYASKVHFYGRTLTRLAVVAAKDAALRQQPTFQQQIVGPLGFERTPDGNLAVSFVKRSGEDGKLRDVEAALVLASGSKGRWEIVTEADAPRTAANDAVSEACQSQAALVTNRLPEVKRAVEEATRAADESNGRARFGGIGPQDDGDGGVVGSLGLHTDERFEGQVTYAVDRKGHLTVTVLGLELSIPPTDLRSVERACHR